MNGFTRLWRGVRALLRGVKFSFACQKRTRNPSRAGSAGDVFLSVKRLALRAGQRQGGVFRLPPPYLWTPLSPQRVKGCSPLTIPKRKSKPKNASRFAKRIFSRFSDLLLRSWCYLSADSNVQQKGEIFGGAVNGRSTKKCVYSNFQK